jgi:hypothetical protein
MSCGYQFVVNLKNEACYSGYTGSSSVSVEYKHKSLCACVKGSQLISNCNFVICGGQNRIQSEVEGVDAGGLDILIQGNTVQLISWNKYGGDNYYPIGNVSINSQCVEQMKAYTRQLRTAASACSLFSALGGNLDLIHQIATFPGE